MSKQTEKWNAEFQELIDGVVTLKKEVENRLQAAEKIQSFLGDLSNKAWDKGCYHSSNEIHSYVTKAIDIENKLLDIKFNMLTVEKVNRAAAPIAMFDLLHGISPGMNANDIRITKEMAGDDAKNIDKAIEQLRAELQENYKALEGTEVHFDENMFTQADLKQIMGAKQEETVKEQEPIKETVVEAVVKEQPVVKKQPKKQQKKAPVSKKEAEEKKITFFARMKTFLTNTLTAAKNVIKTVAKKVVDTAISLKDKFFAKMKTFLVPKVAH